MSSATLLGDQPGSASVAWVVPATVGTWPATSHREPRLVATFQAPE
jgi:hypothetical protein